MQKYTLYIAEPDVINLKLVADTLGDTQHQLIAGTTDFSGGQAADCDTLVIRSVAEVNASILSKMPKLRRVVRVGTGLDNVDLDLCSKNNIAVYNAPGANAEAVADYAVTVIMMALRKLHLLQASDVTNWNRFKFVGRDIATQTVGIVGFGNIGRLLYQKLCGLECRGFLLFDPFVTDAPEHARLVPLAELLRQSDIVSLHLPLLDSTKHMMSTENIALLKDDAILLNAARGGIVDEAAILAALSSKQFTYIADTVENEPWVNPDLIKNPNVFVTPHIASLTSGAEETMVRLAIENLMADKRAVVKGL